MKRERPLINVLVLGLLLALAGGLSQAQGPEPPGPITVQAILGAFALACAMSGLGLK